jgi:hypothetical protein
MNTYYHTILIDFFNRVEKHIPLINSYEYSGYFDGKTIHIFKGSKSKSIFVDGWFLFHTHPIIDNYGLSLSDILAFFLSSSKYLFFKNKKSKILLIKKTIKKKLIKIVKVKTEALLRNYNYDTKINQDELLKTLLKDSIPNDNIFSQLDYFGIIGYKIYKNNIKQIEAKNSRNIVR